MLYDAGDNSSITRIHLVNFPMSNANPASTVKRDKILYWVFAGLIFLLISVPAVFSNSDMAVQSFQQLGFPGYFRIELGVAKVLGGLALMLPMVPSRIKEWAFVGFGIDFISAFIACAAVYGIGQTWLTIVAMVVLVIAYWAFHRLLAAKAITN